MFSFAKKLSKEFKSQSIDHISHRRKGSLASPLLREILEADNESSRKSHSRNSLRQFTSRCFPLRYDVLDAICSSLESRIESKVFESSQDLLRVQNVLLFISDGGGSVNLSKLKNMSTSDLGSALLSVLSVQATPLVNVEVSPIPLIYNAIHIVKVLECYDELHPASIMSVFESVPPENKAALLRILKMLHMYDTDSRHSHCTADSLGMSFAPSMFQLNPAEDIEQIMQCAQLLSRLITNFEDISARTHEGRIFPKPFPLTTQQLDVLFTHATEQTYSMNQVILEEKVPNQSLFCVKSGSVRVMKGDRELRTMGAGSIFGEMSFLGKYMTSASVEASTDQTIILEAKPDVISSIFEADKKLFLDFYWNIADDLANRLIQLPIGYDLTLSSPRRENRSLTISSENPSLSREQTILRGFRTISDSGIDQSVFYVKVYGYFGGFVFKTFACTYRETVASLLQRCLQLFYVSQNASDYKLYIFSKFDDIGVIAQEAKQLDLSQTLVSISGFHTAPENELQTTYFLLSTPAQMSETEALSMTITCPQQVTICHYSCKFGSNSGKLYIGQQILSHFSRKLGLEKKKELLFKDITLVTQDGAKLLLSTKSRVYPVIFTSEQAADDAFRIIRSIQQQFHKLPQFALDEIVEKFVNQFKARPPVPSSSHADLIRNFINSTMNSIRTHPVWKTLNFQELSDLKESIEHYIISQLYSTIINADEDCMKKDKELFRRINRMSFISYSHLDIEEPNDAIEMALACMQLSKLNEMLTWRQKLETLIKCCRVVYKLVNPEKGVDDFLPMLIMVIMKANPVSLLANIQYIRNFGNQNELSSSEEGYYLTQFECAIYFLQNATADSFSGVSEEDFKNIISSNQFLTVHAPSTKRGSTVKEVQEEVIRQRGLLGMHKRLSESKELPQIFRKKVKKSGMIPSVNKKLEQLTDEDDGGSDSDSDSMEQPVIESPDSSSFKIPSFGLARDRNSRRKEKQNAYTNHFRAIVTKHYNAKSWAELSLRNGQVILVTSAERSDSQLSNTFGSGWWCGEFGGCRGWFPKECVTPLLEPGSNVSLQHYGYLSLVDLPTKEDWKLILSGGRTMQFEAGETVLRQGDSHQQLYQIVSGECSVVISDKSIPSPADDTGGGSREASPTARLARRLQLETVKKCVGTLRADEIFGEVGLLLGRPASATIIATTPTEIFLVPADYLKRITCQFPSIGGRFFKFLAVTLEQRVRSRETDAYVPPESPPHSE